ncbi:terminase large subunit (plasmid) [Skermanella sp. TT6]|uniref:Terminase large subunit n=1 Tax=Skermanella cutis TaxID=2775420 RepID=A0ABX7BGN4_9PROT|nr:terminase TerL endonuclease subunit [Skermanella sp. TT6]QQP93548.1 terminase large subunit [Skermanella sp. TT6]
MARPEHISKALKYARDVVAGKIPACKWVVLACQRHLDDLKKAKSKAFPYRFDEEKAARVCRFVENLKHIKGPLAGVNIQLEPWQLFITTAVYGWVFKDGPRKDKRRFRRVYIECPRGNGKSAWTSPLALYMTAADGEGGAEVYSAATTRDQAKIVWATARQMAERSPGLMSALGVQTAAHSIHVLKSASKFEALSAEGNNLDGLNIHFGCIDELHAHRTRAVYDVIETGIGKRDQSLLWCITTAGSDRSGICYEVRTFCTKVLDGVAQDDSQFAIIYTIDDDDDWTSEKSWQKANPNWNVSVMPEIIGQLATKAMAMPSAQNNFLTKHLNVWVSANSSWMDMRAWDRCADPTLDIADFEGDPCVMAVDLASKTDIAAISRLFWRDIDGVRHYYLFNQCYLPEDAVTDGRNSQYSGWEIEGRLKTTMGDVLDFTTIEEDILEDAQRFEVREIAYDPWQATQLSQRLMAEGAACIEYKPTVLNFSEPMKELDALIRQGRLHHDGDPVLAWMMSNVVCHVDNKDNIYPRKERIENKIDGVVSAIMALGRALFGAKSTASVYEDRGIITL